MMRIDTRSPGLTKHLEDNPSYLQVHVWVTASVSNRSREVFAPREMIQNSLFCVTWLMFSTSQDMYLGFTNFQTNDHLLV